MRKTRPTQRMFAGLAIVICIALLVWSLFGHLGADAQAPPPPDTPTFTPTATNTNTPGASTPTPTYTHTPIPPTPTYTHTPVPPSPTATHTRAPGVPTATHTPTTKPPPQPANTNTPRPGTEPKPNPNCLSVVEGDVFDGAGQRATGATVHIQGAGWSNAMMSNDQGHYGFGGLCAGTVTLQAYLLNGQTSQTAQANLNGKDSVRLDLRVQRTGSAAITQAPTSQPTVTPAPDMPATGYSGLLLVGAALLGALLLILAGTRRALSVEEHSRDGD